MSNIHITVQTILQESLHAYYKTLKRGDMQALSTLMTKESYLITLETLGFKRAFKEARFKKLLKMAKEDAEALKEVEEILSADLRRESRIHEIEAVSFESKGESRITLHYREDRHSKKLYFSSSAGEWKIDYKAGRL